MKECDAREKSLSGNCILYCKDCECEWCKYAIPLLWRGATANQINESEFKAMHEQSPSRNPDYLEKELEKLHKEKAKMRETIKLLNGSNEKLTEHNIRLAEENEKLKAENTELSKNNAYLSNRMNEYNCKINSYDEVVKENEQLKAENEYYKLLAGCKCPCHEGYMDCKCKCFPAFKKLQQLKAQLQNCDKASHVDSQTERKPHKCPVCKGIHGTSRIYDDISDELKHLGIAKQDTKGKWFIPCLACNGTGIVWENQQ